MKKLTTPLFILMLSIQLSLPSAQANEFCPLLETGEYGDLLQAVNTLDTQLRQLSPCVQNTADPTQSLAAQDELRRSTQTLQQAWIAPTGQLDPNVFASSISSAMNSLSTIGTNLKNAVAARPECAEALGKNPNILLKFNEVAANLAPMFVLATVMVPTLKAAIPFAVGIAGVTTVINIMSNLRGNKLLKIADPDQAKLVLQSLCQFKNVKKNVDYFLSIQAGRSSVRQSLDQLTSEIQRATQALPSTLQQDMQRFSDFRRQTADELAHLQEPQKTLSMYRQSTVGAENDEVYTCTYILGEARKKTFLSQLPLASFKALAGEYADVPEISNLSAELEAREASSNQLIEAMSDMTKEKKYKECAQYAQSWIINNQNLLWTSNRFISVKANLFFQKISKDPEFVKWRAQTVDRETDKKLLEKVLDFMSDVSPGGVAMARSELSDRLRAIEKVLLGAQGGVTAKMLASVPLLSSWNNSSMTGEWLNYMKGQLISVERQFRESFEKLDAESKNFFVRTYNRKIAPTAGVDLLYLAPFAEYSARNQEWKANACKRLDELWMLSLAAQDHLKSLRFTCSYIQPLINSQSDPEVIRMCGNSFQLDIDSPGKKPWLKEHDLYSQFPESTEKRTEVISRKKIQLGCSTERTLTGLER